MGTIQEWEQLILWWAIDHPWWDDICIALGISDYPETTKPLAIKVE